MTIAGAKERGQQRRECRARKKTRKWRRSEIIFRKIEKRERERERVEGGGGLQIRQLQKEEAEASARMEVTRTEGKNLRGKEEAKPRQ